jgi:indole-3-glycerol phosphate synthase
MVSTNPMQHFGNKLDEILADKQKEVEALLPRLDELKAQARERDDFRSLFTALGGGMRDHEINEGYGVYPMMVIAEVKKASPSAGTIAEDFDPVKIAVEYEEIGADAISVLTDQKYFQGDLAFLQQIRENVSLPLLRKDFIIHESQIYEAVVAGGDAILLIVAALEQDALNHLLDIAGQCQLDVLVEVHDIEEMDRAMETDARIIGVNNRNLRTFDVSLETTEILSQEVGADCILVSESGIKTIEDAARVKAWGADAVLVGEALMRAEDKSAMMEQLKVL